MIVVSVPVSMPRLSPSVFRPLRLALLVPGLLLAPAVGVTSAQVPVAQTFINPATTDQDDMCIWLHPTDPSLSTVIASDAKADSVFVYDLAGNLLQTISTPRSGNIDVRYDIQLGGECVDLIAFNEKGDETIHVYRVDPVTRTLVRVDDGAIATGPNYGMTLYRHEDGSLFVVTGPKGTPFLLRQYELFDNGTGQISGAATGWEFLETTVEGMVGDDETGYLYLAEQDIGIWRVDALDDTDKTLIAQEGDASGLVQDIEGITVYHATDGAGYIIASSQPASKYTIIDRLPPHAPVGEFTVDGVGLTDGLDVLNVSLGEAFPQGIFLFHNGLDCCPVQAARWEDVAQEVGLGVDTGGWNPRAGCGPHVSISRSELEWTGAAPASTYDVVLGDLQLLRSSLGDFMQATLDCMTDNHGETTLPYSDDPPAGTDYWFLVRGEADFGSLTYDSFGRGQLASRDEGIELSAFSCP